MNDPELDELFAAARRAVPETSRLEYAFETRLLARLRAEREGSVLAWAWRLCPLFVALAVALTFWNRQAVELPADPPLFAVMVEEQEPLGFLAGDL